MSINYEGMRWLKCDLQMQTPADLQNWQGEPLTAGQENVFAQKFAEACYATGLNVIGITDHNFLSKDLIPKIKEALKEIERKYSHQIIMFPGFEFEAAGVGKGAHILCLFEPETDLNKIDSILTECGIGHPRKENGKLVKSDLNLKDILKIVQNKHKGIVIIPHLLSNDGLFDNNKISEWLQQDQFVNPDLLAVEIPKPVNKMNPAFQCLFGSGEGCTPEWKRIRPIATIMSSDNKKLIELDENKKPKPNTIGYRYTWIKMSNPSIESLRQAFLDHESRIILPENNYQDINPSEKQKIEKIVSISIKNTAFLADQIIYFSPNMNCVIGGRGSGKSTLIEYLRIVLGKDKTSDIDKSTAERIQRIKDTLNTQGAKLEVIWINKDGVEDIITWENSALRIADEEFIDLNTFFDNLPIQVFSQQQLNHITDTVTTNNKPRESNRLLKLIDGFAKNDLLTLGKKELDTKRKVKELFSVTRKIAELNKELKQSKQEQHNLERQWKARSEIQTEANKHQQIKLEKEYLDSVIQKTKDSLPNIEQLATSIIDSHPSFQVENSPHKDWFIQLDKKVKQIKDNIYSEILTAIRKFDTDVEAILNEDPDWPNIHKEIESSEQRFLKACEEKGLSPEDVDRIKDIYDLKAQKQNEIDKLTQEISELTNFSNDLQESLNHLHIVWRDQYHKRNKAATSANQLAVPSNNKKPFLEVTVQYQSSYEHFQELWESFAPQDRRKRLGKNWEELGNELFESFKLNDEYHSPWQMLNDLLHSKLAPPQLMNDNLSELKAHLSENNEDWDNLQCLRVNDSVDITLYHKDGSKAGSISEGSLSDGQRNTATLALLLAQDGGPLIIDQPEDELDSSYIFNELIPMLRNVKSKRQLIISTHNANLPVNGDSEYVYGFEARDRKGNCIASGGLDNSIVTKAILDIMEGSEEAFRKRREKYNF
ncbi:TPA: AAA family ATPase [Legionella pneumophila]|nr:AAA family ATPase [Legionella pneumophila]